MTEISRVQHQVASTLANSSQRFTVTDYTAIFVKRLEFRLSILYYIARYDRNRTLSRIILYTHAGYGNSVVLDLVFLWIPLTAIDLNATPVVKLSAR